MKKNNTRNKLAFAAADIFGGGSFNIVNFLYPGFLALTVGLSPFWISFVMFVARVWDAVSDPLMGIISDATQNTRFGKRRVYLVAAAPLVVLAMFLMFFPFTFDSVALRVAAVLFSYLLFCTVQTMVMIPYYSLSSEISSDYQQRASANSMRLACSIFSSILCVAVPGVVVNAFPGNTGYIVMSLIFGVVFGLSVLVTGLFTREEIITPPVRRRFQLREFAGVLQLRPFRQYLGMLLVLQMTMAIMSSLFFFYVDFYLCRDSTASGQGSALGLIGAGSMFATQIVALPFYLWLIGKTSKAFAYRLGSYIWILTAAALFFVRPGASNLLVIALCVIVGFGISGAGLVPHAMFGDVADAAELAFGQRREGSMSGLVNFINKIAQAVGLSLVMMCLGFCGFVEKQPNGPAILAQPESAQLAIRAIIAFAPLLLMSIGVAISLGYSIDRQRQQAIKAQLDSRNHDGTQTDSSSQLLR
ncbi:MAG: MFS transporter [Angelakisella sp.]